MISRTRRLAATAVLTVPALAACGSSDSPAAQPIDVEIAPTGDAQAPTADALDGVSFDVRRDPG